MDGFQITITIILGLTGISVSVLLGIFLFKNSNAQSITAMSNTISKISGDVSGFGQTLGEVKKGIEILDRDLPIKIDEVKIESATAHAGITSNIAKTKKKVNKRTKRLIRESEQRIIAQINTNTSTSNNSSNTTNQ